MNTNMIDLEFLGNTKHMVKKKENVDNSHIDKKEMKFYRKRILETTKNLLRNKTTTDDIKPIFDKYVEECIKHYKHMDTLSFYSDNNKNNNESSSTMEKTKAMKKITRQDINNLTQDILNRGVNNENKIEDFISVKKFNKKSIIFPKKQTVNLKDPKFKKTNKSKNKKTDKKSDKK